VVPFEVLRGDESISVQGLFTYLYKPVMLLFYAVVGHKAGAMTVMLL
jgi:hypothetical protein